MIFSREVLGKKVFLNFTPQKGKWKCLTNRLECLRQNTEYSQKQTILRVTSSMDDNARHLKPLPTIEPQRSTLQEYTSKLITKRIHWWSNRRYN